MADKVDLGVSSPRLPISAAACAMATKRGPEMDDHGAKKPMHAKASMRRCGPVGLLLRLRASAGATSLTQSRRRRTATSFRRLFCSRAAPDSCACVRAPDRARVPIVVFARELTRRVAVSGGDATADPMCSYT
jgi:hypothetical protein